VTYFLAKERLREQLKPALTIGGPFRMASGAISDTMLDLSKVLREHKTQEALAEMFRQSNLLRFDAVGGPVCGSDLVCAALCRAGIAPHWFGVRKEEKGRGYDNGAITGNLSPGDRVLVVEDVCTSGGTLIRAIREIRKFGAEVGSVLTVVDRGGLLNVASEFPSAPTKALFLLDELRV